MEMKLDTTEYSSLSSSHNENKQDLYVAGIREFCKHDFAKDFETHVGNFSASSEILSLLKIKGRSYYAVKDFQNAYQTIFLGYQDVVKKCEALKVILKNTESIIGKKSERPKTYQKQSFRSLVVGSGAMRKRLDLLSEFMLQLAGEYEINGDSKRYLTKEEKTAIVHKDLIPKWLSYKKSSFATKTEAVINSPNIQKRNQSTLEKSVTDFEKDPVNISLEYLTSKELLITENRLKKVKGQKVARQLFLGPLGSTKIPSIKMTRGNIKKAKTYIRETFPGGEGNVAPVHVCHRLFPIRHAMFRLSELLRTAILSLDNEICDKYRLWFLDENDSPLQWVYEIALPIDGSRMPGCGVGAQGGDSAVTLLLAQILNYPLSVGKPTHNLLVAILNCPETKFYLKLALHFLQLDVNEMEEHAFKVKLRSGEEQTIIFRWRSKGDLKWNNTLQSCGTQSCDVSLAHFMVWKSFLALTWWVLIERRNAGQAYEFSRTVTSTNSYTGGVETIEYLCAHHIQHDLATELCGNNNSSLREASLSNPGVNEKSLIDNVRQTAQSNGNNFVTTLGFRIFDEVVKNDGVDFDRHMHDVNDPNNREHKKFFYEISDPRTDPATAFAILGLCHFLFTFTYDVMHLSMNLHNRGLKRAISCAETRALAQGAVQHEFSVEKRVGSKTSTSSYCAFDLKTLGDDIVMHRIVSALKISSPSIAKWLTTFHDADRGAEERTLAASKDPTAKQAANFVRQSSLICQALAFSGETANMKEFRVALHLWMHLSRATSDWHFKYLFTFFCDELVLSFLGVLFHKLSVIYGFGCPPNSFAHFRGLPAQMTDDRHRFKVSSTEALGPQVTSSSQSSEGSNYSFRQYFDAWSNKGPDAFTQVAFTYLYVYVLGKAVVKPRTEVDMGGPLLPGETILDRLRTLDAKSVFFKHEGDLKHPSKLSPQRQTMFERVHNAVKFPSVDCADRLVCWRYCFTCAEFFSTDENVPLQSSSTLRQKIIHLLQEARSTLTKKDRTEFLKQHLWVSQEQVSWCLCLTHSILKLLDLFQRL